MSKEQVMDYVMTTPSNPNRAVLSGMLDEISGTQLPSPTESDNGKVLGVDGGEYKLVNAGSEVEYIKITTAGGGSSRVTNSLNLFSGGGTLVDNKSLAELVGDKHIVDFVFVDTNTSSKTPVMGAITFGRSNYNGIIEYESAKAETMCNVIALSSNTVYGLDVYAICI